MARLISGVSGVDLVANKANKIRFSEIERNVPEKPGIYEIHTDAGIALKVGIGVNIRRRLLQHRASRQSCLKLRPGGHRCNQSDVQSKGSILTKHLYYDKSITVAYDLMAERGRRMFLDERCYILFKITASMASARELEKRLEGCGRFRYMNLVKKL